MENLELFKKVQRAEAPPFLLTRIQAKIRSAETERLPASWRWVGALTCGLLLFFNIYVLKTEKTLSLAPAEQIAQSIDIQMSNQLYDE
jgi:hypothetical protein